MRILLGEGDDISAQRMPELFSSDVVPAVAALMACEEPTNSRDMCLVIFRRNSGYAKIIRYGRSARW